MTEGTIDNFNHNRGFGFITVQNQRNVFFHISEWRGSDQPQVGQTVTFTIGPGQQGKPAAKNVTPTVLPSRQAQGSQHNPAQQQTSHSGLNQDRFYNPYNFIRYLDHVEDHTNDSHDVRILGQMAPPPHDRWLGLSGELTCNATVVTPLFIAGAENVTSDEKVEKHKHFHFFAVNGKKAVPASSLRGMLRNIFEAVTNSRFGQFSQDTFPLEYRQARVPKGITPVRVCAKLKNGMFALEKLDCTKPGDHQNVMNAAWVNAYVPKVQRRQGRGMINGDYNLSTTIQGWATQGKRVAALVSKEPRQHRSNRFSYYEVQPNSITLAVNHDTITPQPGYEKVFGYLYMTGPNIERKHDERLFFRRGDINDTDHMFKNLKNEPNAKEIIELIEAEVVEEYNQRLAEYFERNQKEAAKPRNRTNWPLTSEFVKSGKQLKKGDLAYLITDPSSGRKYLRPVSLPRLPYQHPRQKLLPKHMHPALIQTDLTPADRVFGWVQGHNQEGAYRGRIQFSFGAFDEEKLKVLESEVQLAILSTPKPTTTRFYLIDKSWQAKERDDKSAGYDNLNNRIRGRKIYRHFQPSQINKKNYQSKPEDKSDQNRTVHDVVAPSSEFEFSIQFLNFHPIELGALLWSIELEEGMHHRLGMAKPLGFGSLQIKLKKSGLKFLDTQKRYKKLDTPPYEDADSEIKSVLILNFKKALVRRYKADIAKRLEAQKAGDERWVQAFSKLENVADLQALLSATLSDLPIHYPSLPGADGENFQWFMNNKKSMRGPQHRRVRGEWIELEVPEIEMKGNGLPRDVTGQRDT
jgi:CRISPR-associated protein (TIGR03986 family)